MQRKVLILSTAAAGLVFVLVMSALLLHDHDLTRAEDIPADTIMLQLGAYLSISEAHAAWEGLRSNPLIESTTAKMIMLKARAEDHDIYRLRLIGFADRNSARKLCSDLVDQTISCIPIQKR